MSGPGVSTSSSVTLTGGGISSLSFSYNSAYGGISQVYTVSSDVGTLTVTVYPVPPTVRLTETDGAGDGSTGGAATFTAIGGTSGATDTVNYTISGPDDSTSTGSVTLTGGGSSSLSFSYNADSGGFSQAYTVTSDVGTVTVTVYPVPVIPPTVTLTETNGATDGSTGGTATFTASGGTTGATDTVNYTITNPDGSTSTGSVSLTNGESSPLSFSYNPAYGGSSPQSYTINSDVGTQTVTVYSVPVVPPTVTLTETDGAGDGSTGGTATFTATGGTSGTTDTVNYSINGPGVSTSSSVTLTGGGSSSLSFSYNAAYGGASQAYTVSSDVGMTTVTVYPVPVVVPPGITLIETDGATDGSTGGTATFTASGGTSGAYGESNYTITYPDGSTSTSSVSLTSGGSSSLSFSYNSAYGGASQAYTVSSDVGTVAVTVYEVPPTDGSGDGSTDEAPAISLSEMDGANDGSTAGVATFTASGGTPGTYGESNYTITYPDGSTGSSSVSLTGGGSSSMWFSYNPAYGDSSSQSYTVSSDVGTVTVTVYPVAVTVVAPTVSVPGSQGVATGSSLILSSANGNAISVADTAADGNGDSEQLSLSVSVGTLTLGSTSDLTFTSGDNNSDSSTIVVTGTLEAINAALSSGLTYTPDGSFGSDTLNVGIEDMENDLTGSGSASIIQLPTANVPTITQSVISGSSVTYGISVSDAEADVNGDAEQLSLSVSTGTLTLNSTSGLTFENSTTNGTASFTVLGTLEDINTDLDSGLTYTPSGSSSSDTLNVGIYDQENSLSGSGTVSINVIQPPTVNGPTSTQSVANGSSLVFSSANGNAISVTDVAADDNGDWEQLSLSVSQGTLTLGNTSGLTFENLSSNGTASFIVEGSLEDINTALNSGLTYTPNTNYSGSDTLNIGISDLENGLSASGTVSIDVTDPLTAANNQTVQPMPGTYASGTLNVTDSNIGWSVTSVSGAGLTWNALSGNWEGTTAHGGSVTVNPDGTFLYTAPATGTEDSDDSFSYTVTDSYGATATGTLSLNVDQLTASSQNLFVAAGTTSQSGNVSFGGNFPSNNAISIDGVPADGSSVDDTSYGTVTMNSSGYFNYTVTDLADFIASGDSFTYTVQDSNGCQATGTVYLTAVSNQTIGVAAGSSGSGSLVASPLSGFTFSSSASGSTDASGNTTYNLTNGTVVVDSYGDFSYTSNSDASGGDSIAFTLTDPLSSSTHNVTLNFDPTLNALISGNADTQEGASYTLNLTPPQGVSLSGGSWAINWGDGTTSDTLAGSATSDAHDYGLGDGGGATDYEVTATFIDGQGNTYVANSLPLEVDPANPGVTIVGNSTVPGGSVYSLNLSGYEPTGNTVTGWTVNWGDGTEDAPDIDTYDGPAAVVTHLYTNPDDDAPYTIIATASDDNGSFASNALVVTVQPFSPYDIPGLEIEDSSGNTESSTVAAGNTFTLVLAQSSGDAVNSWTINWGDGNTTTVPANSNGPTTATYTYEAGTTAAPWQYTVTATGTNDQGTFASNSLSLTATAVAPTLTVSGAGSVQGGTLYTLNLAADESDGDTLSGWQIHWGDGTAVETVDGGDDSATHVYANAAASYTITATAIDSGNPNGTVSGYSATVPVTVTAAATNFTVQGDNTTIVANDNGSNNYTLTLTQTSGAAFTGGTIGWGDGSADNAVVPGQTSYTHSYADGDSLGTNQYTITATASNSEGTFVANTTVAVEPVPPTVTIASDLGNLISASTVIGALYTIDLSAIEPGPNSVSGWVVNWGDGTSGTPDIQNMDGDPSTLTHIYAQPSSSGTPYLITATATDNVGTYDSNSLDVTVNSISDVPVLSISGNDTVTEGSTFTLNLSQTAGDTFAGYTVNWGDGTASTLAAGTTSATHTYADAGTPGPWDYSITATGTNDQGTFPASSPVALTVNSVAPTVSISGLDSVLEGVIYTLDLSATEPTGGTVASWTINWGDGTISTILGNPQTTTHLYATSPPDDAPDFTIQASVTDDFGTTTASPISVGYTQETPVFSISGDSSVDDGDTYTLDLNQTQGAPVASWTINWGDGTDQDPDIQTVPNTSPIVTHVYGPGATSGSSTYTITVTASDAQGNSYSTSSSVTVDLQDGDLTAADVQPVDFTEVDDAEVADGEATHSIDLNSIFQDTLNPFDPLSYSVVDNSDDTILSNVRIDSGSSNLLDLTLAPDTYGYSEVTVEASDSSGDTLDATILVIVTPVEPGPTWIPGVDQNGDQITASIDLSSSGPTYVDLWQYFTDLQDKSYLQYPSGSATITNDANVLLGGSGTVLPIDSNDFVEIPALPTTDGYAYSITETISFSVTATNSAGLTVTGNFEDTVTIPGYDDNPTGPSPIQPFQPIELIATATNGVDGGSGEVTLTRSGGGDGTSEHPPHLPDMTVQYYISGQFTPTGVPLSGTVHFAYNATSPDSGEGSWTITDPNWGTATPQGPESDTFDFTASDPQYGPASAVVTIEPTPPAPSVTLTINDSSDLYYLPQDNGNENGNTALQYVTVDNPSDGNPETIAVLAPIPNNQADRELRNTVSFGANGVVEAGLTINYPGINTLGTLTFDFGDDLQLWWTGPHDEYDRWVPIGQGASFVGISSNTSYTLLVQGIVDGSDGITATFTPESSGSGSGGQHSGNLPINVFSVSVSITGPTEVVRGATSATVITVDDDWYLGYTDGYGDPVADDSSMVTQIPLNADDPYIQTATITFSDTVPAGTPYILSIPAGYRLFDPTTGDLLTTLSGTVPASRVVTELVQATDAGPDPVILAQVQPQQGGLAAHGGAAVQAPSPLSYSIFFEGTNGKTWTAWTYSTISTLANSLTRGRLGLAVAGYDFGQPSYLASGATGRSHPRISHRSSRFIMETSVTRSVTDRTQAMEATSAFILGLPVGKYDVTVDFDIFAMVNPTAGGLGFSGTASFGHSTKTDLSLTLQKEVGTTWYGRVWKPVTIPIDVTTQNASPKLFQYVVSASQRIANAEQSTLLDILVSGEANVVSVTPTRSAGSP